MTREEIVELRFKSIPKRQRLRAARTVLGDCKPLETNDFEIPNRITPQTARIEEAADAWELICAPFSLTTVTFDVA